MARFVVLLVLISAAVKGSQAEGLWVANQARYECDDNNDGSTARVVACVPSNSLGGKEYAVGETWKGTEYKYLCTRTYPMQLALQKIGCVTPTGEELQPGNSSIIPDKGEYKCVTKGVKDKEVFLNYKPGCYYNSRLYAVDETLRNGSIVLACKADGQKYSIRAVGCISNEKAIPAGDFVQTGPGAYSKCQVQADNVTAALVPATEKEYNDWLASSVHTTMAVPTTTTAPKTTVTLAQIPTRTTMKAPKDCKDKHPLCADLCAYPCFEDPNPLTNPRIFFPIYNNVGRPIVQAIAQAPAYVINGVSQVLIPQVQQYPGWPQNSWQPAQAQQWPQNAWQPPQQAQPWNPNSWNPWWQPPTTTKKPKHPWEDDIKGGSDSGKPGRPAAGLCRIWTSLGKEGVEKMCPKSCKVIGCKYEYPE